MDQRPELGTQKKSADLRYLRKSACICGWIFIRVYSRPFVVGFNDGAESDRLWRCTTQEFGDERGGGVIEDFGGRTNLLDVSMVHHYDPIG
jgi:hypothetical protein